MSDKMLPILKDIIDILKADTSIAGYVDERVYADVPDNETFPYITVYIDSRPWDTKEITGMDNFVNINIYSRYKGIKQAADIRKSVYDALNRQEGLFDLSAAVLVNFDGLSQIRKDSDGATWSCNIDFKILTQ